MALTLLRLAPVSASARGLAAVAQRSVRRRRAGFRPALPVPPLPLSPGLWAAALRVSVSGGRLCPRCRFADRPRGPRTSPASVSQGPEANRPPAALEREAGLQAP